MHPSQAPDATVSPAKVDPINWYDGVDDTESDVSALSKISDQGSDIMDSVEELTWTIEQLQDRMWYHNQDSPSASPYPGL
jgi:hypothetical protein